VITVGRQQKQQKREAYVLLQVSQPPVGDSLRITENRKYKRPIW
jgi:hypothetical protein